MKKVRLVLVMASVALFLFSACEKSIDISKKSIEGTYVGTLTTANNLKSTTTIKGDSSDATMDVVDTGNGQIQLHCVGGDLDTTFMLNYYENGDSMMVCLSGDAFEEMYGHMMGQDSMSNDMMGGNSNNMMGGMTGGQTSWMNHMNTEHNQGDKHFGGFDMKNDSFDFIMKREAGDYHFNGTKK